MRIMSAREAKNHFGELLMDAQREPVTIERNGKPVAVVQSFEDHEEVQRLKLEWLRAAVAESRRASELEGDAELTDELFEQILCEAGVDAAE